MKAVTDDLVNRVERNELVRALHLHEKKAAELRSKLGFVVRETVNIDPAIEPVDPISRMRTDQIDRLYEKGKINADQRAAALKIRTVWEAMGRGLFPSGSFGSGGGTKSRGTFRHPLERMTNREFFIWIKEYRPWATGAAAKVAINHSQTGFRISFMQICYHVAVDGFGPTQLERQWPVTRGKGVVTDLLRRGLSTWEHIEYYADAGLEDARQEILKTARSRIEEVHPAHRKA